MITLMAEQVSVVWSPWKKDIRKLESIHRITTKMVPEIQNMSYEDRLKEMELLALEQRRKRNIITLHKFVNKINKVDTDNLLLTARLRRGHGKKFKKGICLRNLKRHSFPRINVGM